VVDVKKKEGSDLIFNPKVKALTILCWQ